MELKRIEQMSKRSQSQDSNFSNSPYEEGEQNRDRSQSKVMMIHIDLTPKGKLIIKSFLFLVAISFILLGKAFGVPVADYQIINDPVMYDWLSGINEQVNSNLSFAKSLQISSGICMDLSFFALFGYWVLYINTGRLMYTMASFYVVRGIVQKFVGFPFPEGYYWTDPGFPSLTVPYGHSSDFFWSGHCGFLTIIACEWFKNKKQVMFVTTCLVTVFMAFVMIGFRIHYTVDVIIGVMVAHYLFILLSDAAPYLDNKVKSIFNSVWKKINKNSDQNKDTSNEIVNTDLQNTSSKQLRKPSLE